MTIAASLTQAIGNTPLIRLNRASERTGCEILGKAEWMNPGGSVKDRAALAIIEDGEARGLIKPGCTIVEGTAGNTGIGLTHVAKAKGYKSLIVMPDTQSQEKKDAIRLIGAELLEVPAKPYKDPANFIRQSERIADEMNAAEPGSAYWANQFDNVANADGHYKTTGPEIWEQTGGKVDGFICAVGSGGSLVGVARYLREQKPDVAIGLSDPYGANLYNYYTKGELSTEGGSITEGIGQGRITKVLEGFTPDHVFRASDEEALNEVFDLIAHEGIAAGGSAGINITGAIRLAEKLGPGHTIVTLLCDHMSRYTSKLMNPAFLDEKGLPKPGWSL